MGIDLDDMVVWDFDKPQGGLSVEQIKTAKMILWKGFCSVHQMFSPDQIDRFRTKYPEGRVISHPESAFEVCEKSDEVGSTEYIIKTVKVSAPGTRWLVGTELNLVNRLHEQVKDEGKHVHFMASTISMCSTMFRTDPPALLNILEGLVDGRAINQIRVPESDAAQARVALNRMLEIG